MTEPPAPRVREYRLRLSIDFERRAFSGDVEIDLEVDGGPLVIHASGLEVSRVRAGDRALEYTMHPAEEEVEIHGAGPGAHTIRLDFAGHATDKGLIGLYESRYGSDFVLTTQCAPIGARQIFPCVDRPDRKAPIRLTLEIPAVLSAIFNTPPEHESTGNGRKTLVFAPTPPMATYLFYLGVGRFDVLKGPADRVRIDVFAPPGRAASGAFALDYARRFLPAFEEYFGIDYPLPKLDLIAVPQYAYGAMENWGAIVFRDMYVLIDAATSTRTKRWALDTIAHEIAHQWFGNLVTMSWWDDIWLNESFATFLEMRLIERLDPSLGSLENYIAYWIPLAFEGDSLPHTHPVTTRVDHPSQIAQVFDEISYGKGSAILRMIEAYLGEEAFRRGVADFLNRFRYANARSKDLWDAFDRQGPEPVRPLLETWTERPGHPMLSVTREGDELVLRQRRFALDGRHTEEHWTVPLTYEVDGALHRRQLRGPVDRVPIPQAASYHLNPGAVGFYRVRYDDEGYDALLRATPRRSAVDRWTVLHDLDAFLYSGDVSFERFGQFVAAEIDATDHLTVRLVAEKLLDQWFVLGASSPLHAVGHSFLARQLARLGPRRRPGEPETDGILRERIAAGVAWQDPEGARTLAEAYPEPALADADLRGPVALALARHGDATIYANLQRTLGETTTEGEALDYETALASFRQPELTATTLEMLDDRTINRAHLPQVVRRLAWNPEARDPLWDWMRTKLSGVAEETKGTGFSAYVLEYALPYVGLPRAAEVREWVAEHPVAEGGRGAKKGLGLLDANLALERRVTRARGP